MGCVRSRSFSSSRSGRVARCHLFSMSSLWSPSSEGLVMRGQFQPCVVSLLLALIQQGFPRSPMISPSLCPAAWTKKAVAEYEQIVGVKVNFDKSEGLRLGAWMGSDTLPRPFRWSDGPVRILGCGLGLTSNWSEIGRKYRPR